MKKRNHVFKIYALLIFFVFLPTRGSSQPGPFYNPETGRLETVVLGEREADRKLGLLLQQVLEQKAQNPEIEQKVRILHVGEEMSASLKEFVRRLIENNIAVEGTLLNQEKFWNKIAQIPEPDLAPQDEPQKKNALVEVKQKLLMWTQRLFGLSSRGVTFIEHVFVKKNGKWGLRYPNQGWMKLAVPSTLVSNSIFSMTLFANGMSVEDSSFWLSNLALGFFVFSSISASQEITSFKMQGHHPFWDKTRKDNPLVAEDRGATNSRLFFTASSLGQEAILFAMLLPALVGVNHITSHDLVMGGLNGFFSVYSYLFPAQVMSQMLKKSEGYAKKQLLEDAQKWNKYALAFSFGWFSVLYPAIKFSHLLFSGDLSSNSEWAAFVPLTLVGTLGMGMQAWQMRHQLKLQIRSFLKALFGHPSDCRSILLVESRVPSNK